MIRTDTFFRSVAFAAAAAVGSVAWLVCVAPVLGGRRLTLTGDHASINAHERSHRSHRSS